jgi:hypothetical protein
LVDGNVLKPKLAWRGILRPGCRMQQQAHEQARE